MNFQNRTATNQQNQRPSETMLYLVPQHVSVTEGSADESPTQIIGRQEKFIRLEKKTRYKLASAETGKKIQSIGQKYSFELLRLANITRLVREYYFGEVRFENFATEIEKRMGVSLLTAQEIARYIRSEIIDWDPWGEYIAKLPKLSIREILAKYPKIADTEITSGYIELKTSEDLEDPTIKNWIHDYVLHLGQERHSQMERTQYLFHSENGQNLSSSDREKLGIILKSFDENTLLPVDEESGEIVFEGVGDAYMRPLHEEQKPASQTPNDFIKPYPAYVKTPADVNTLAGKPAAPQTRAQTQTPPLAKISYQVTSSMPEPQPQRNFTNPNPVSRPQPAAPQNEAGRETDKFFNAPETPDIPSIKIHGITEHNEPRAVPQIPPRPQIQRPIPPQPEARPKYRIIDPFSGPMPEPRIDGNIVDLSNNQ